MAFQIFLSQSLSFLFRFLTPLRALFVGPHLLDLLSLLVADDDLSAGLLLYD
jgi:hypothetical protein